MIRTQIQLTGEQMRRLRGMARRRGMSVAAVIRQAVDGLLQTTTDSRAERYSLASSLVGKFADRDSATDVATHHDDYLEESYG